jgi:hypothetical protein
VHQLLEQEVEIFTSIVNKELLNVVDKDLFKIKLIMYA